MPLANCRTLALAIAAISVAALGLNLAGALPGVPFYISIGGLALSGAILATPGVGAFLTFFIVFYGLGYIGLITLLMLGGLLKLGWAAAIPPLTALTSAAFGLLAILLHRIPVTRGVFRIADPYFKSDDKGTIQFWPFGSITARERWIAYVLLGIIIVINLAQVGITVRLNQWNRDFYDALQNKNAAEFWRQLLWIWMPIVTVWILTNILELVLISVFKIRWREWLTQRLTGRWLGEGTHYKLQFSGGVDNPDQRIQEDIRKYTETTYSLTISMISQISTLVSFSVILWGLSSNLPVPGTETKVPGMLFWIALVYAGIGTYIAHVIGRRLIPLNFEQEKYEANFRFMLARLREYNEPIALLRGEGTERKRLAERFRFVVSNFMEMVHVQKWLNAFTSFYGMANSVIPIVILAPFFFTGVVTLGVLTQTAGAFARVDAALAFFIDRYATLADFKAVVDRLSSFEASIDKALESQEASKIESAPNGTDALSIPALKLALPSGQPMLDVKDLTIRAGERTLLTGPSGSGKSTLFRAIAGIWPFGDGRIDLPSEGSIMLLPQRPYIPIGPLRQAVSYPAADGSFSDEAIRDALTRVHLTHLLPRMDEATNWSQVLSGGEQQRLAVARAILARPGWLFLDEATSALDEGLEAAIYAALREALPQTTLVSIGHRSSLIGIHDRRIELKKGEDGLYSPREVTPATA